MRPFTILIVEDDCSTNEILRLYLEREGFSVYSSTNAADGLKLMEEVTPTIVLLDLKLPDKSGFDLARKYRERSDGILIFITGEKTKTSILQGFEIGCDDYITKPFDPPEVVARIKANLRRMPSQPSNILTLGNLTINFSDKTVYKNGKLLELFTKEKRLLFYLARHPNQIFSAEQLYELLWGYSSDADLKTVLVNLSTLRKKIENDPKSPQYIQTVRGFGYKFCCPVPFSKLSK